MEKFLSSTTERLLSGVGISLMATGAFAIAYLNPTTAGFFPACPFHALTGLNCPGCGLTRGFHALSRGDVSTALHYNALLPVYLLLFLYLFVSLGLILFRGRGFSFRLVSPAIAYGFLIASFVFAVWRNLPFYPLTFPAP